MRRVFKPLALVITLLLMIVSMVAALYAQIPQRNAPNSRPRERDLGIHPGIYEPGPLNAITDVSGVRVGQVTIVSGGDVRTGVTAIFPHAGNMFQDKVAGAVYVCNAFGKLVCSTRGQ